VFAQDRRQSVFTVNRAGHCQGMMENINDSGKSCIIRGFEFFSYGAGFGGLDIDPPGKRATQTIVTKKCYR
jgi:hypothetical protein